MFQVSICILEAVQNTVHCMLDKAATVSLLYMNTTRKKGHMQLSRNWYQDLGLDEKIKDTPISALLRLTTLQYMLCYLLTLFAINLQIFIVILNRSFGRRTQFSFTNWRPGAWWRHRSRRQQSFSCWTFRETSPFRAVVLSESVNIIRGHSAYFLPWLHGCG